MSEVVGNSAGIVAVRERVERLLQRRPDSHRLPTVLIEGETGTGKGLLARTLHERGPRASGPLVHVNCAAIPETLLEAELFGFERGAFTDARQAKPGLFQTAHRGVLFLDEVALLPAPLQGKLLTVVEDRAVRRLGATRSEGVDVWIIAAASQNLEAEARAKRFREDLYHRLALVTLRLPPLRERGDDILLLAEHYLARACTEYGLRRKDLAADARAALMAYPWPGNVRELANLMERVALLSDGPIVNAQMLELPLAAPSTQPPPPETASLHDTVTAAERERLLAVLQETRWNFSWAAEKLGIPRNTLRYRVSRLGLRPDSPLPPLRQRAKGAATAGRPAAVAPADTRRERRHISLLRAVLDEPHDFGRDAAGQLEACVDKARPFGARIEELTDHSLVAAFGVEPVEDAPRRAALAAIAIQRGASRAGVRVRLAIHVAAMMLDRVGDTVSLADEDRHHGWGTLDDLVATAEPGQPLVSATAAPFLQRRFALTRVDAGAFRLPERESSGLATYHFLGREDEMAILTARLRAARAGQGQIIGIVGEAGIGKSRLLAEIRRRLGSEAVTVLEAPCQSYAVAIPYFPLAAVVRSRCGIADSDGTEIITAKIRSTLGTLGMDPHIAGSYLLRLLGVEGDDTALAEVSSTTIQGRTFEILRQMCLRDARRQPLVLVVEDAHWIDRTSESFLASLAGTLAASAIALVTTYRPGYRPPWMEQSYATQIALPPLSADDSRRLAEMLLEATGVPTTFVDAILARAEGNPFFLEELTRSVRDEGGAREAAPETIEAVLRARIERLPPATRQILEAASVIGREVPAQLLSMVNDTPDDVLPQLETLTRLEFLHASPGGDDLTYVFKHSLTQDVAYAGLASERRRALHGAVGRAIERLYPERREELCEVLAHHYQLSDDAEKAVEFLDVANRKAAKASAMLEAKACFDAALARLEALPDTAVRRERRVTLVLNQVLVMTLLFRFDEYHAVLKRYESIAASLGRTTLLGALYARLGLCQWAVGDYDRATETLARAVSLCESSGNDDDAAQAYVVSQWNRLYTGDFEEVLRFADRVAVVMKRRFDRRWHVYALTAAARACGSLGRWRAGIEHATRALAAAEDWSESSLIAQAALTTGLVLCAKGDLEAARQYGELALAKAPTLADQVWARAILAWIWCRAGDAARGVPVLAEVVDKSRAARWRAGEFYAVWLGEGQALLGATAEAETTLHACVETASRHGMRYVVGCGQRLLGELAMARDPAAAAVHLERSIAILEALGAENDVALACAAYGRLRAGSGDSAQARQYLIRALEIFERLETLIEPERVRTLLSTLPERH